MADVTHLLASLRWKKMGRSRLSVAACHGHLAAMCGVVWCGVVWCGVEWCGVVRCGVVRWCVVWCGVVWCGVPHCRWIAVGCIAMDMACRGWMKTCHGFDARH